MKFLLHSFDCKGKQKYWNREGFCELVSFLHHQSACSSAPQHSFVSTSALLRQYFSTPSPALQYFFSSTLILLSQYFSTSVPVLQYFQSRTNRSTTDGRRRIWV